jgi:foldase protein PrsA
MPVIASGNEQDSILNPVVAEFGNFSIRFDEYRYTYYEILKQPTVYDSKQLRESILEELIARRLLAAEAEKNNYGMDEELQYRADAYRNKCLRDAHFKYVIKPNVKVTEEDNSKVYRFLQEKRRISHLFFNTKEEADSVYQLIIKGASFKELAKQVFTDSALSASGGDLGWVFWDQLDYDLSMAAFTLPVNQPSEPVKSQFGYHIIMVTDYQKNPLISEYEYQAHKQKAKTLLEYHLSDKYAFEYIGEMMKKADVVVMANVMKAVRDKVQAQVTRKPGKYDSMSEVQLNDEEIKKVNEDLGSRRKEVMAAINGINYTVGDFIGDLAYIPYNITYTDFTAAFNYAVRNFLLAKEAESLGLGQDEEVITKANLFREYFVSAKFRRKLVDDARVTEEEIEKYYDENQEIIKGAPYDAMYPVLEKQLLRDKQMNVSQEYVKILLKDAEVKKRMDIINNYYDALYSRKSTDLINIK